MGEHGNYLQIFWTLKNTVLITYLSTCSEKEFSRNIGYSPLSLRWNETDAASSWDIYNDSEAY